MTSATALQPDIGADQLGRTQQLQQLMVQWRKRLDRKQIPGLVRSKGVVTQEEMAFLCTVTGSYYRALERGRIDRNYSEQVLDTFARIARLSSSERTVLYLLATGREPRPHPYAPPKITPAVLAQLNCQPWPTFIANATWDVIACNEATMAWLPFLEWDTNLMRATFLQPQVRLQLVDWQAVHAPHAIAQLRARYSQMPNHEGLQKLIRDILRGSPEARRLWTTDPTVWLHNDGDRQTIYLPGATEPTIIEVVTTTPGRNPDLRTTSLVPQGGYVPDDCRDHLRGAELAAAA